MNPTVELSSFCKEDASAMATWAMDDEVTEHMMWDTYANLEEIEAFIETVVIPHPWFKAIHADGVIVGAIDLIRGTGAHACRAELGYVLAKKHWGRGIATEAVKEAVAAGFGTLGLARIEATVDPENQGSVRVLEKVGFQCEGTLRNYVMVNGNLRDRLIYSKLPDGSRC